jgi:uncharacterized protein with GYD domain
MMGDYVVLCKLTAEGAKAVMQIGQMMQAKQDQMQQQGIKVIGAYLLFGSYDWIWLVEAPDDETLTLAVLQLVADGLLTSETMRAFTLGMCQQMMQKLAPATS